MKHKRDLDGLDRFFGSTVVDMAVARMGPLEKVVELARSYASEFQLITGQLLEATALAKTHEEYREAVANSTSRDCFLLTYGEDLATKPANQLQARLEFEGLKSAAYLSVREGLLVAQESYKSAFRGFKSLFPNA